MLGPMTHPSSFPQTRAPAPFGEVLAGQVIAVTGADSGYGKSISTALARIGASVVLIGNNSETLAASASALEHSGGHTIPIKADVGVPLDWLSAQNRILEIFGVLHGIVHLADKRTSASFTMLSENEWMELFNSNVKSSVAIAQILARRLPETWLTIVGPHTDEPGLQAHPQRGALRGLVEAGAREDLRLNLLLPSPGEQRGRDAGPSAGRRGARAGDPPHAPPARQRDGRSPGPGPQGAAARGAGVRDPGSVRRGL